MPGALQGSEAERGGGTNGAIREGKMSLEKYCFSEALCPRAHALLQALATVLHFTNEPSSRITMPDEDAVLGAAEQELLS